MGAATTSGGFRRAAAVTVAAIALALGACSSSKPASSSADTTSPSSGSTAGATTSSSVASSRDVDPCSLLDAATVQAAVGNPVADGDGASLTCNWRSDTLGQVDVVLTVDLADPSHAAGKCAASTEVQPGQTSADIPGLGDKAVWTYRGAGDASNGHLAICRSDGVVIVGLVGNRAEPAMRTAAQTLARAALAKL